MAAITFRLIRRDSRDLEDAGSLVFTVGIGQNIGGGGSELLTGLTLWVDGTNGSDLTGTRGRQDKPYATLAAARTAASSGDLIHVRPHSTGYSTPALKDGVNWHLDAGVSIGQVSDGGVPCVCRISGLGAVTASGPNSGFSLTHAGSTLVAEVAAVTVESGGLMAAGHAGLLDLTVRGDVTATAYDALIVTGGAVVLRCRDLLASSDAIALEGAGTAVVSARRVYGEAAAINDEGGTTATRLTLFCDSLEDAGDGITVADAAVAVYAGRVLLVGGISLVGAGAVAVYSPAVTHGGLSGDVRLLTRTLPAVETSGTLAAGTVYPVGGVSASFARTWTTLTLQGVSGSGNVTLKKNGATVGSPIAFTTGEADTAVTIDMAVGDRLTAETTAAVYLGLAGVRT